MIAYKYKVKDEQYNYPLLWIAGLLWLMGSLDRNRGITTSHMTIITDKRMIIIKRLVFLMLNFKTKLRKQSRLSTKIPIAHYQVHHHLVVPAVSPM